MPAELISFRLPDEAIEALRVQRKPGESLNLTAQRVVLAALGFTDVNQAVNRNGFDSVVDSIVNSERFSELLEEKLASVVNSVNGLLTEHGKRLENLEKPIA